MREARPRGMRGRRDHAIKRKGTRAANHQERRNGQRQQVIFESFALLCATPVHEEPEAAVHHGDRDHHIYSDSEGGDPCEESQDQPQTAKELGGNREVGERRGNVQVTREKAMVPENPGPPNQPNIFCAPCAKKTTPRTSLRSAVAELSSVANSLRSISDLLSFNPTKRASVISRTQQFMRCVILR